MAITIGYARISTGKQKIDRQIFDIHQKYPGIEIIEEVYTGTKFQGRDKLNELFSRIQEGDTIVFESVSRMSRNAEEGFSTYEELYKKGVNLVFLKEPHINTETYRETLRSRGIQMTGTDVDIILEAVNRYLLLLAKKQIQLAFKAAQDEVDYLHYRTSEGLAAAKRAGKRIGAVKGKKLFVRKSETDKVFIIENSRDFKGILCDAEIARACRTSRSTIAKFKSELKALCITDTEGFLQYQEKVFGKDRWRKPSTC